jgi:hypothetical protein
VFVDDIGLHLLGAGRFLHFNGVKVTSLHAGLATIAFRFVNDCAVPAGGQHGMDVTVVSHRLHDHAATGTAVACRGYLSSIGGNVNLSGILHLKAGIHGLFY